MDLGWLTEVFGAAAPVVAVVILAVAGAVIASREYERHKRLRIHVDRFRLDAQRAADQEAQSELTEVISKLESLVPDLAVSREVEAALAPDVAPGLARWDPSDIDLAQQLWARLSGPGRELFTHLARNPHLRFSGDELAERLGLANGRLGVAGVAAWPARRARELGRPSPISWNESDGKYWMDDVPAELFSQLASLDGLRPN